MALDVSIGSGLTLLRLIRSAFTWIGWALRNPYSAIRHIQYLKWWGLSWDWRSFLGMSAQGPGPIYVACLQAYCVNTSSSDVRSIRGHIQSNVTGERLPLTMEGMTPEETNGIPAKCKFLIQALFRDPRSEREGIIEDKFLEIWRDFSFVFTADKKEYQYRFRQGEVIECIGKFRQGTTKQPPPQITRKVAR